MLEMTGLVLSGVAVHLQLCVRLPLLFQRVAVHLKSVFWTQGPVEEQAGDPHFADRLGGGFGP